MRTLKPTQRNAVEVISFKGHSRDKYCWDISWLDYGGYITFQVLPIHNLTKQYGKSINIIHLSPIKPKIMFYQTNSNNIVALFARN